MKLKRKICIVTGTRAEYGLFYWLLKAIDEDAELQLQLMVTGMHLAPEFGSTYRVIEEDGFRIDAKVEMLLSSDSPVGISKSLGLGVMGAAEALAQLKPDVLVVLGDRFETLAFAAAAMVARIPIAHIAGGEATEGQIDEAIRHSLTKMAHFHFVSAEPYRRRVIQLGESPDRVFNVGATGIDNILQLNLLSQEDLEKSIHSSLGARYFLVTYHPVTLTLESPQKPVRELFAALDRFPDYKILFTQPNADTEGRIIWRLIQEYVRKDPKRCLAVQSLGRLRYLSAMKHASLVIGNSSSGIIEAPALKVGTVNLGDRQRGRLRTHSIIDCEEDREMVFHAIEKGLNASFQAQLPLTKSPYGDGEASSQIKEILKTAKLEGVLKKHFYDLEGVPA